MATPVKLTHQAHTEERLRLCPVSPAGASRLVKRVQKGRAGHRLELHPKHFVSTEIPLSCPLTGKRSNGKPGAAETLCCCRHVLLGRESPLRCVILAKRQPVTTGCFCRVSLLSPLFLSSNRKIEVGQKLEKILMLVLESPRG